MRIYFLFRGELHRNCFDWYDCSSKYVDPKTGYDKIVLNKTIFLFDVETMKAYVPSSKQVNLLIYSSFKNREKLFPKFDCPSSEIDVLEWDDVGEIDVEKLSAFSNTDGIVIKTTENPSIPNPPFCNTVLFAINEDCLEEYPQISPLIRWSMKYNVLLQQNHFSFPSCGDIKRATQKGNNDHMSRLLFGHLII